MLCCGHQHLLTADFSSYRAETKRSKENCAFLPKFSRFWYFSLTSRKNVSRFDSRGRSHFPLPCPTPTSPPSLRLRPRYAHRHRPRTLQQQQPITTGPQHRPTAGVNNKFITTAKEPPLPTYRSQRRPMAGTKPNFIEYRRYRGPRCPSTPPYSPLPYVNAFPLPSVSRHRLRP
jgi:hypothetical protein